MAKTRLEVVELLGGRCQCPGCPVQLPAEMTVWPTRRPGRPEVPRRPRSVKWYREILEDAVRPRVAPAVPRLRGWQNDGGAQMSPLTAQFDRLELDHHLSSNPESRSMLRAKYGTGPFLV